MVHGKTCRISEVKQGQIEPYLQGDPELLDEVIKNKSKVLESGTNISIAPDADLRIEISFQNCKRLNAFR